MNWDSEDIAGIIRRALEEDIGTGDATVLATIPERAVGSARILAREDMVCAGLPLAERVFRALDPQMRVKLFVADGDSAESGQTLLHLDGSARAILSGERVALNFLGHLSGIATMTGRFVEQLAGTKAKIRDTRKTTPGLRALEKYAVKTGGGTNHRLGLYDAILLKENHIALAGGVKAALDRAHAYASLQVSPLRATTSYEAAGSEDRSIKGNSLPVQIEVRDERELREAIEAGAGSVLLDNMTPEQARACVALARKLRQHCIVEISGGITPQNARAYAETGADYLSSGALTHSAPAANVSLLVDNLKEK
jgi:nicotinate-nucleotide pyrophosphorylase (carboxylating)